MRKILTSICLLLSLAMLSQTPVYTVKTVPSPKDFAKGTASPTEVRNGYVSNPDGLLDQRYIGYINGQLDSLEIATGVQMAVVALNSIGNVPASSFAVDLFNYWGIGDAQKNTGLLLLWVPSQRYVQITTGTGMEKYLTDADCGYILDEFLIPEFKDSCYSAGIIKAIWAVEAYLDDPETRAELLTSFEKKTEPEWVWWLCWYITAMMIALIWLCYRSVVVVKRKEGEGNDKAVARVQNLVMGMTFLTVLFPTLYFLRKWAKGKETAIRKMPFNCEKCGHKMQLLNESEEDQYLNAIQQAEEKVGSYDHDVWHCPQCQATKIYSYRLNTDYDRCAACGAVTMKLTSDTVLERATHYSSGRGCKLYTCANCGHITKSIYIIPKIVESSGSGGSGGSRSGGGSSSWGGGHSSGGGAGRSY